MTREQLDTMEKLYLERSDTLDASSYGVPDLIAMARECLDLRERERLYGMAAGLMPLSMTEADAKKAAAYWANRANLLEWHNATLSAQLLDHSRLVNELREALDVLAGQDYSLYRGNGSDVLCVVYSQIDGSETVYTGQTPLEALQKARGGRDKRCKSQRSE